MLLWTQASCAALVTRTIMAKLCGMSPWRSTLTRSVVQCDQVLPEQVKVKVHVTRDLYISDDNRSSRHITTHGSGRGPHEYESRACWGSLCTHWR